MPDYSRKQIKAEIYKRMFEDSVNGGGYKNWTPQEFADILGVRLSKVVSCMDEMTVDLLKLENETYSLAEISRMRVSQEIQRIEYERLDKLSVQMLSVGDKDYLKKALRDSMRQLERTTDIKSPSYNLFEDKIGVIVIRNNRLLRAIEDFGLFEDAAAQMTYNEFVDWITQRLKTSLPKA